MEKDTIEKEIKKSPEHDDENSNEKEQNNQTEKIETENNNRTLTKKQEFINFVKFTLFSISAGIIQVLSFTLLNEVIIKDTGSKYGWSYFIALVLSVLWN